MIKKKKKIKMKMQRIKYVNTTKLKILGTYNIIYRYILSFFTCKNSKMFIH